MILRWRGTIIDHCSLSGARVGAHVWIHLGLWCYVQQNMESARYLHQYQAQQKSKHRSSSRKTALEFMWLRSELTSQLTSRHSPAWFRDHEPVGKNRRNELERIADRVN